VAKTACSLLVALLLAGGCRSAPPPRAAAVTSLAGTALGDPLLVVTEHPPEGVNAGAPLGSTLTLSEALRRAVTHDPRIQVSLAEARSAEADARQTRLLPNPVLTLIVRFREGGGSPVVEADVAADLLSLLARPRQISAADYRLRAAVRDALTAVLDAVAEVEEGYAGVQAVEQELAVLRDRRASSDRLLAVGRARLKAGEAASTDVITLESQRLELDVDIADKEADRADARLTLARLVGEPGADAAWDVTPWAPVEPLDGTDAAWVQAALRARPEILAKRWTLAALGDDEALAAWAPWSGGDIGFNSEYDQGWTAGPALTTPLPLFDWGQAKRAKARAERVAARHGLTQIWRKTVEEVRSAHARYLASAATARKARDELLPLQERRWNQLRAAYESGETDLTTFLTAEDDLRSTRLKVIDLEKKAIIAGSRLRRAVGGGGTAGPLMPPAAPPVPQMLPATRPQSQP
jgi:outer membrane protein TolC